MQKTHFYTAITAKSQHRVSTLTLVCLLPADSLRDKFQVVVSSHELSKARELADAWWNPVKVQLVCVNIKLL